MFISDLDNTLIYSYKHNIGNDRVNVEVYQGREISFITARTYELLKYLSENMMFIPNTTRTAEQYQRINLGIGIPHFALVCNGGVLLVVGVEDRSWYRQSLELISDAESEMKKAFKLFESDRRRIFELRYIRQLFLFTKCNNPGDVVSELRNELDMSQVDVFNNGIKVYVLPKSLNKGNAVLRLKDMTGLNDQKIYAAGDSEFDIPMLKAADIAIAPYKPLKAFTSVDNLNVMKGEKVYSEEILEFILNNENLKSQAI